MSKIRKNNKKIYKIKKIIQTMKKEISKKIIIKINKKIKCHSNKIILLIKMIQINNHKKHNYYKINKIIINKMKT